MINLVQVAHKILPLEVNYVLIVRLGILITVLIHVDNVFQVVKIAHGTQLILKCSA